MLVSMAAVGRRAQANRRTLERTSVANCGRFVSVWRKSPCVTAAVAQTPPPSEYLDNVALTSSVVSP